MKDAGADFIFDFVDAGLPSTVCTLGALRLTLNHIEHGSHDLLKSRVCICCQTIGKHGCVADNFFTG